MLIEICGLGAVWCDRRMGVSRLTRGVCVLGTWLGDFIVVGSLGAWIRLLRGLSPAQLCILVVASEYCRGGCAFEESCIPWQGREEGEGCVHSAAHPRGVSIVCHKSEGGDGVLHKAPQRIRFRNSSGGQKSVYGCFTRVLVPRALFRSSSSLEFTGAAGSVCADLNVHCAC